MHDEQEGRPRTAEVDQRCAKLGAEGYLQKPIRLDRLLEVLARFILLG